MLQKGGGQTVGKWVYNWAKLRLMADYTINYVVSIVGWISHHNSDYPDVSIYSWMGFSRKVWGTFL